MSFPTLQYAPRAWAYGTRTLTEHPIFNFSSVRTYEVSTAVIYPVEALLIDITGKGILLNMNNWMGWTGDNAWVSNIRVDSGTKYRFDSVHHYATAVGSISPKATAQMIPFKSKLEVWMTTNVGNTARYVYTVLLFSKVVREEKRTVSLDERHSTDIIEFYDEKDNVVHTIRNTYLKEPKFEEPTDTLSILLTRLQAMQEKVSRLR